MISTPEISSYEIELETARSRAPAHKESPAFAGLSRIAGAGFEPATFGL